MPQVRDSNFLPKGGDIRRLHATFAGMTYLEKRQKFAEGIGMPNLFEFIDHWQLYVGQENLSRFLTIYEALQEIQNLSGDIVELGSWQGGNLLGIAKNAPTPKSK